MDGMDTDRAIGELNLEAMRDKSNQMIEIITNPGFVEAMRQVRAAPAEERLEAGRKYLTPESLREAGVPIPDDMRISSRYFDDELPEPIVTGLKPEDIIGGTGPGGFDPTVAAGGCACGGGLSFCGGAGGST